MILLLAILSIFLLLIIGIFAFYLKAITQPQKTKKRAKHSRKAHRKGIDFAFLSIPKSTNSKIDLKALTTLTHSQEVSKRLFKQCLRKYPDQSPQWCLEKCILDLSRDRRF
ncbi:hypothetical protein [Spirulina major]|uniref:hypothetical protein n=1 Tax=Spirulina major TaxID=270636 RepID=UPI0009344A32|nr:hypothetical protein [Spirulina major]